MTTAFFDLDKTLISENSANLWVGLQWKQGRLTKKQLFKLYLGLIQYKLGMAHLENHFHQAIKHIKGQVYADLEADARHFYQTQIRHLFRPGALSALESHKKKGDTNIILSTSPKAFASLAAEELGMAHCLASEFEVDALGYCTGNWIKPVCYGAGKLEIATRWLKTQGLSLSDCVFYTDSYTDMPMLEAVGHPVVVNPDRRLSRAAKIKKWPIVDWGRNRVAKI